MPRLALLRSRARTADRSEEHTSELQSRTLISYAVFCLKKKKVVGLHDHAGRIGGERGLVATLAHREAVELLDRIVRPADDCGSELLFFGGGLGTLMRFQRVHPLSLHDALPI